MPLPLGHIAVGLAVHEMGSERSAWNRLGLLAAICVLANLPDIDVVIGLVCRWNGSAFHRGPTHSLLFALAAGFAASRCLRLSPWLPRMGFWMCFSLVLSHVAADALLSSSAVSFFWPIEVHYATGHTTWGEVAGMVLKDELEDAWIALAAALVIAMRRTAPALLPARLRPEPDEPRRPPGARRPA
jgi:hypothetical protein